jgi:hypothetical protein
MRGKMVASWVSFDASEWDVNTEDEADPPPSEKAKRAEVQKAVAGIMTEDQGASRRKLRDCFTAISDMLNSPQKKKRASFGGIERDTNTENKADGPSSVEEAQRAEVQKTLADIFAHEQDTSRTKLRDFFTAIFNMLDSPQRKRAAN